ILLFLWWYCRIPWLLYYRNISHNVTGSDINEFDYDVFIVHGESSTTWVWNVLVPKLEHFGFSCFLPDRDILGGEEDMSAISSVVGRCLRVLVVVTPCVQDELSEKWALLQGYRTSLHSNTRIFAIILQNIALSISKSKLHKMLDNVTKIRVPPALQNHTSNSERLRASVYGPSEATDSTSVLTNISISNSVERNDITGRNIQMRLVHQDSCVSEASVPGSPCSNTPFILPIQTRMTSVQQPVTASICACMQVICCGNVHEKFWQEVRFQLPPYPLSNTKRIASQQ
ncbi:unnamed protein product, partial [Meganyctiphanes norvegica]